MLVRTVAQMSFAAGTLALVVLLIRPPVKVKLPGITMKLLWTIVLFLFLCPIRPKSEISVYNLFGLPQTTDGGIAVNAVSPTEAGEEVLQLKEGIPSVSGGDRTDHKKRLTEGIWMCGSAVTFLWFSVLACRLYAGLKSKRPLTNSDALAAVSATGCRVRIYASGLITTPITYGLINRKIVLPERLLLAGQEKLEYIICHEMQHIRQRDNMINYLWLLVLVIHWFNPLAWVAWRFLRKDTELYCDECVIKKMGMRCKAEYAQLLLDLTDVRQEHILFHSFGSSVTGTRIRNVLSLRKHSLFSWMGMGALIIVLTLFFASEGMSADAAVPVCSDTATVFSKEPLRYLVFENSVTYAEDSKKISESYGAYQDFASWKEVTDYLSVRYGLDDSKLDEKLHLIKKGFGKNYGTEIVSFSVNCQHYVVNTEKGQEYFTVADAKSYNRIRGAGQLTEELAGTDWNGTYDIISLDE